MQLSLSKPRGGLGRGNLRVGTRGGAVCGLFVTSGDQVLHLARHLLRDRPGDRAFVEVLRAASVTSNSSSSACRAWHPRL